MAARMLLLGSSAVAMDVRIRIEAQFQRRQLGRRGMRMGVLRLVVLPRTGPTGRLKVLPASITAEVERLPITNCPVRSRFSNLHPTDRVNTLHRSRQSFA